MPKSETNKYVYFILLYQKMQSDVCAMAVQRWGPVKWEKRNGKRYSSHGCFPEAGRRGDLEVAELNSYWNGCPKLYVFYFKCFIQLGAFEHIILYEFTASFSHLNWCDWDVLYFNVNSCNVWAPYQQGPSMTMPTVPMLMGSFTLDPGMLLYHLAGDVDAKTSRKTEGLLQEMPMAFYVRGNTAPWLTWLTICMLL